MHILPINLDDLMRIESVRLEFKKSWSEHTLEQVIRTVGAFANDFFNLNGGYIVVGIDEENGIARLPPHGLDNEDIDEIQKQIRGACNRISPDYQPVISPETYQGKKIVVVWCPAGDLRPYQAPTGKKDRPYAYYVRQGAESVEARDETLTQLMQMTAKVPFDDRRNLEATIDVISPTLVRNYLSDIASSLVAPEVTIGDLDLYRGLNLLRKVNGHEVPRNAALLFFVNKPEQFFPGARIEIVQFGNGAGGDLIEEKIFRGPIHHQLREALDYLESFSSTSIRKIPNQAEARRWIAFPFEAMREALVNAVYHRGYDGVTEPIKVYLYPDRIEITSYPGPVPGIEKHHLEPGAALPKVPYRNRRIGEFLKDLKLTEGRGSGIPKIRLKMKQNGSPAPIFDFDETRTYFTTTLPAHPQYIVIHALRESAQLWANGERQSAIHALEAAVAKAPGSGALIAQLIRYRTDAGDLEGAMRFFSRIESKMESDLEMTGRHLPFMAMSKALLDQGRAEEAAAILAGAPAPSNADEATELALLSERLRSQSTERVNSQLTGSIIFVHGTGVRLEGYRKDFDLIQQKLARYSPGWTLVECPWGDAHGVKLHLEGKSIPDYLMRPPVQDELMRWWRLYQDPLCELRELAALDAGEVWTAPGQEAAWKRLDQAIRAFTISEALRERLAACGLDSFWEAAARAVEESEESAGAVERAGAYPGHFRRGFARAVFATTAAAASASGRAAASGSVRDEIIDLVVRELGGDDLGVRDLGKASLGALRSVGNIFGASLGAIAAYTGVFSRATITDKSLPAAGDILLYQARGGGIREFIKSKIAGAAPPVYLLAHSLGGIACVDLLAMEALPVAGLITAGSQAPLLYEMNALVSLEEGAPLPPFFPKRWLNFYDPNDLLSYRGEKVFPNRVKDVEISSRQPFPQAHSAYWRESRVWEEVARFFKEVKP